MNIKRIAKYPGMLSQKIIFYCKQFSNVPNVIYNKSSCFNGLWHVSTTSLLVEQLDQTKLI